MKGLALKFCVKLAYSSLVLSSKWQTGGGVADDFCLSKGNAP